MAPKNPEGQFNDSQFNILANSLKQQGALLKGILDAINKQRSETDKYRNRLKSKSATEKSFAPQLRDSKGRFEKQSAAEKMFGHVLERQKYNIEQLNLRHKNLFSLLENINPALSGLIQTIMRLGATFSAFSKLLGSIVRVGSALFFVFKPIVDRYRDTVKGVFESGFGGKMAMKETTVDRVQNLGAQMFNNTGIITSAEDMTKYTTATATAMQNWKIPDSLILDVGYLNKAFMMSVESAVQLQTDLYRMSGNSSKVAHHTTQYAQALAELNNMNPGALFEAMAENSEELAKNVGKSKDGWVSGLATIQKIGVSMTAISRLADTFSTDFESTLEMQAKIQTLSPGVDLSKAIYASNFGSLQQTIQSLQEAVAPLGGFENMTRGMKNMLAQSFGFSVSDLSKLISGKDINVETPTADAVAKAQIDSSTQLARLVGGTDGILDTLKNIYGLLMSSVFFGNGAGGGSISEKYLKEGTTPAAIEHAKSKMSGAGLTDYMEQLGPKMGVVNWGNVQLGMRHSGGPITDLAAMPKKIDSFKSNEILTVLKKGEWVLTEPQQKALLQTISLNSNNFSENFGLNATKSPSIDTLSQAPAKRTQDDSGMAPGTVTDMKGVERKLDELLNLIRNGGFQAQVNMDGQRLTKFLIEANNRG